MHAMHLNNEYNISLRVLVYAFLASVRGYGYTRRDVNGLLVLLCQRRLTPRRRYASLTTTEGSGDGINTLWLFFLLVYLRC